MTGTGFLPLDWAGSGLEAAPDVRAWTQYGQLEDWEQPFRADFLMLALALAAIGLSAGIAVAVAVMTDDWDAVQLPIVLFLTFTILGVGGTLFSTRAARHVILRMVPVGRGEAIAAVNGALVKHKVPFLRRSQDHSIRPPGRKYDEVFSLMGGSVWIGIGPPWFTEDKHGSQIVMGPATRENERRISQLAWTLHDDLYALGFTPLATQRRTGLGGGGLFAPRRARASGDGVTLSSRPWRTLVEADGWTRQSTRVPWALRAVGYAISIVVFVLIYAGDRVLPAEAALSAKWALLGVIALLLVVVLIRRRTAGKDIVRRVGLPPEAAAVAVESALRETGPEPRVLQSGQRPDLSTGPCFAAYEQGPLHAWVSGRIIGAVLSPRTECDILLGPATDEHDPRLARLAWHIERRIRDRRKDVVGPAGFEPTTIRL